MRKRVFRTVPVNSREDVAAQRAAQIKRELAAEPTSKHQRMWAEVQRMYRAECSTSKTVSHA